LYSAKKRKLTKEKTSPYIGQRLGKGVVKTKRTLHDGISVSELSSTKLQAIAEAGKLIWASIVVFL